MPRKPKKPAARQTHTRDGSSAARAILEDQWRWRERNCPGATLALQVLSPGPPGTYGKYYDVLTLWTVDGEQWVVWFDVSNCFGKGLADSKKRLKSVKGRRS